MLLLLYKNVNRSPPHDIPFTIFQNYRKINWNERRMTVEVSESIYKPNHLHKSNSNLQTPICWKFLRILLDDGFACVMIRPLYKRFLLKTTISNEKHQVNTTHCHFFYYGEMDASFHILRWISQGSKIKESKKLLWKWY